MSVQPVTLASRSPRCQICKRVAFIEDVNARLFNDAGDPQPIAEAADYVLSIGVGMPRSSLNNSLRQHQEHVGKWLRGEPVAPGEVQRIEIAESPASWVSVNQQSMNMGLDALRSLAARLQAGDLEPKEEIELAKLGLNAAHKRGDIEMRRGMLRDEEDDLLRLVSGYEADT